MAFPNIIGGLILAPKVKEALTEYWTNLKAFKDAVSSGHSLRNILDIMHYIIYYLYLQKCRQVSLLLFAKRFALNDLILFHNVVYDLTPLKMPDYL